ncbi:MULTISPECIES: hypothetical protein [unclassified Microbacterium]|uniref:hypothetical protein n=1 Tax=unclassified Microbacterium TaxID=2609290 RepID=UPI00214CE373|nr:MULTISPECIES: hypothetical protein [unclassified Microbacterium]MCR2785310.1 hypothetical protein [Microbacterium sp. zg.B96]WIM16838.1 hypothetical protein QNO11_04120 [Microbacterium sp. zg-B96]
MPADLDTTAALQARVDELEAENARLAATAAALPPEGGARPPRRHTWRAIVSALCIVVATILVPVSIVGAWVRVELVEADRFVATMGPIIEDPDVQALLIDNTTAAIEEQLNLEQVTNDLFDGIAELGLPSRAATALDLLRGPAAQGAQSLIDQTVTRLVESDAFADIWERALSASHRTLIAAAGGGETGAVTVDQSGVIGIELGPIVAEVKERLVDRGVGIAAGIPDVERTIVVGQVEELATLRASYAAAVAVGAWLPVITLVLFLAGILIARRRITALLGVGVGLFIGSAILTTIIAIGPLVLGVIAADLQLPSAALAAMYEQVIADMRQTAIVGMVLGGILGVVAWSQGRWHSAGVVRGGVSTVNGTIRGSLAERGFSTGVFGRWMDRYRVLVRAVICVLAVVWLWLLRPLGVADVAGVLVVALLAWWVCELLRSPADAAAEARAESPVADEDTVGVAS